jgi:exosortase
MSVALDASRRSAWTTIAWFSLLVAVCYAPVITAMVHHWSMFAEFGHAFFVPPMAAFIAWQRKEELLAVEARPTWWGLPMVVLGAGALIAATMGVELFVARFALLLTITGVVWTLGGPSILRRAAFPLFVLLFMIPIPDVAYNRITFPLQLLASRFAGQALTILGVPVLREGNILELPNQRLSVVEACSGIRSLLSLTFLGVIYGYFFEKKTWIRVVLLGATVPIAIVANASRVMLTGIVSQIKPELAEGTFHESTGWVVFMVALMILIGSHQVLRSIDRRLFPEPQPQKEAAAVPPA